MKTMQVFDCQDMPKDLLRAFFEISESGNDCYINWELSNEWHDPKHQKDVIQIDDWLRNNGATDKQVLIAHWW